MTANEMEKEVYDYCLNLILNSTVEEWLDEPLIFNNIKIDTKYKEFQVRIYTDNTLKTENKIIIYDCSFGFCNKEKRRIKKLLSQKWNEINTAIQNKKQYEYALETYNLLPIKEIRKRKLQTINEDK